MRYPFPHRARTRRSEPVPVLPDWLCWLTGLAALLTLLLALPALPWRRLADSRRQHLFLGASVALMLLWSLRATVTPGVTIHLLGMTTLTLMFGWRLALAAAALAGIGLGVAGTEPWRETGAAFLTAAVVPALTTAAVLRWVERWLPAHFFVYLFGGAFFGAAAGALAGALAHGLLLLGAGWTPGQVYAGYWMLLPLFLLPEAMLNGFVVTGLVAHRPDWVDSFDDARYLNGK